YDRRWLDEPSIGDHVGRAIWALGDVLTRGAVAPVVHPARCLLHRLVGLLDPAELWPRTIAYTLLGLAGLDLKGDFAQLADALAERLVAHHARHADERWEWFEEVLTYDNARLSQALVAIGSARSRADWLDL